MRYSNLIKEKENGVVYTPTAMADYLAAEMIKYKPCINADYIRILDPAIGRGELVYALLNIVAYSCPQIEVVGYETDAAICKEVENRLSNAFPNVTISIKNEDFLQAVNDKTVGLFDYVIANPPYIRTQIIGSDKAQELASQYGLSGRVDIYYAFIVCTSAVLKENGVAGYITSNKFLTIKSGSNVRDYMLDNYKIHRITDLGDTKLFSASVLPCIMVFSKGITENENKVSYTSVYQTFNDETDGKIDDIFDAIYESGCYELPDGKKYRYQQGVLQGTHKGDLWTIQSDESQKWLSVVVRKTWQ